MMETILANGPEAVAAFSAKLDEFFQNGGKMYTVERDADGYLGMLPFTGCGAEDVALTLQTCGALSLKHHEMLVIDSCNETGAPWKGVFYPSAQIFTCVPTAV